MSKAAHLLEEPDRPERVPVPKPPSSWSPGTSEFDEEKNKGFISTPASEDETPPGDWDSILKMWGFDPAHYEIVGSINRRQWSAQTSEGLRNLHYFRANIQKKGEGKLGDLSQLMKIAAKVAKSKRTIKSGSKPKWSVVAFADTQLGKSDRLGGTPEALERHAVIQTKLDEYLSRVGSEKAAFFDLGDIVEGFENTAQQARTNDLSLMDQLDLASTLERQYIELVRQRHNLTYVAGIGSNHCQWRNGKNVLGKPRDDWGLFIQRQIKKSFNLPGMNYTDLKFFEPEEWSESVTLNLDGSYVGAVHGHQVSNPNQIPTWWANQTHGAGPVAHAEILLTGHFHHFLARQSGKSIYSGKPKIHLQAPTLDNGSSWFTNLRGEGSQPGLLVFTVDQDGLRWDDLSIITA